MPPESNQEYSTSQECHHLAGPVQGRKKNLDHFRSLLSPIEAALVGGNQEHIPQLS